MIPFWCSFSSVSFSHYQFPLAVSVSSGPISQNSRKTPPNMRNNPSTCHQVVSAPLYSPRDISRLSISSELLFVKLLEVSSALQLILYASFRLFSLASFSYLFHYDTALPSLHKFQNLKRSKQTTYDERYTS